MTYFDGEGDQQTPATEPQPQAAPAESGAETNTRRHEPRGVLYFTDERSESNPIPIHRPSEARPILTLCVLRH